MTDSSKIGFITADASNDAPAPACQDDDEAREADFGSYNSQEAGQ